MHKFINKIAYLLFALSILILLCTCDAKARTKASAYSPRNIPFQSTFLAFDTECSISIYGKMNEKDANNCINEIKKTIDWYDKTFSKTNIDSEVYKINHRNSDIIYTYKEVGDLFIIIKLLYEWSDKVFDVSAGTLFDLWDVKHRKTLPSKNELDEAAKHIMNYDYIVDNTGEGDRPYRITFRGDRDTIYDFGALVKGYVCEVIKKDYINYPGLDGMIINLGGNVCCIGEKVSKDDKLFKVGIFKPFTSGEIAEVVSVKDKSVVTSGNYQRYFKVPGDDRIYHHIIDTRTLYPTNNNLDSVSIITNNAMLGDYLSTSCMILGEEKAKELINFCSTEFDDKELEAIYIYSDSHISKYKVNS